MGDLHVDVVDDNTQMVGRHAVRSKQYKILDRGEAVLNTAKYLIGEFNRSFRRHLEAEDLGLALTLSFLDLGICQNPASAIILPGQLCLRDSLSLGRQRLYGTKARIGVPRCLQLRRHATILIQSLRLKERPLVPVQSQPAHALENAFDHFGGRPLDVCVFNAEDEPSLVMLCEEPIEKRGSGATDMEEAGWGGCEANPDLRQMENPPFRNGGESG